MKASGCPQRVVTVVAAVRGGVGPSAEDRLPWGGAGGAVGWRTVARGLVARVASEMADYVRSAPTVAISERTCTRLAQTPLPDGPSAVNLMLPLPAGAEPTGLDHVMPDWDPGGHEPEHVYSHDTPMRRMRACGACNGSPFVAIKPSELTSCNALTLWIKGREQRLALWIHGTGDAGATLTVAPGV